MRSVTREYGVHAYQRPGGHDPYSGTTDVMSATHTQVDQEQVVRDEAGCERRWHVWDRRRIEVHVRQRSTDQPAFGIASVEALSQLEADEFGAENR